MKKVNYIIALVVVVLVVATSVAIGRIGNNNDDNSKEPGVTAEVKYEVIEDNELLPEEILQAIENLKTEKGYFVFGEPAFEVEEDETFLLVASGEKRTGGYDISVEAIEEDETILKMTVKETEPEKDEMVIQVITYPYMVINLDKSYDGYEIVNTEGEEFSNLAEVKIEEPETELEEGLKAIPETDPRVGESFVEGEVIAVDAKNRQLELDIHLDTHTPDVEPQFEVLEDALLRQLENDKETEIAFEDLEEGMIVGMILTPDGKVRAIINHVFEF